MSIDTQTAERIDSGTGPTVAEKAVAMPPKARKPAKAKDPKTAAAAAAHKAERKAAKKATPARPVAAAVLAAETGAPTRTFAIRITTAELDAIHAAAGPRGASKAAKAVMEAFARHDVKGFNDAVKAAKANGGKASK